MSEGDRTGPAGARSRTVSRGVAKAPMTLDEAVRIEQQFERGSLDLSLPGTSDIVAEAHRVRLKAELWGADRTDDRRWAQARQEARRPHGGGGAERFGRW